MNIILSPIVEQISNPMCQKFKLLEIFGSLLWSSIIFSLYGYPIMATQEALKIALCLGGGFQAMLYLKGIISEDIVPRNISFKETTIEMIRLSQEEG